MCAERVALYNAIAAGQKEFKKIAVASNQKKEFSPCGACRQALAEFNHGLEVIWHDAEGKIKTSTLKNLMPFAFKKYAK
jgi:cytidine deaminase